jgi:predicted peptidase
MNQQSHGLFCPRMLSSGLMLIVLWNMEGLVLMAQQPSTDAKDNMSLKLAELAKLYEPREFVGSVKVPLKYRLLKPWGYEHGKKYPLIVFLHGAGERGDDNVITLKHAAKDLADEARRKEYPSYVLVPQCPTDKKWSDVDWSLPTSTLPEEPSESMRSVKELIDEMIENAGVDPDRVYLTGLSMGGYGTWDAIARYPNFFAAAAPICGGGDPATANRFAGLPIWCFHGAKDSVVKVSRSREMIEAIQKTGGKVLYTEYPEAQHDSWTETYSNSELYRWLFTQRRTKVND